jgi:hypothetical protein
MSSQTSRPLGPNDPLYYAPKWALEEDAPRRPVRRASAALPLAADQTERARMFTRNRAAEDRRAADAAIAHLRHSPSLDPEMTPEPMLRPRTDYWLKLFARLMLVAVVAQAVVVIAVGMPAVTSLGLPAFGGLWAKIFATAPAAPAAKSGKLDAARLAGDGASGAVDEPLRIGVTLMGNADGDFVVVDNLAAGTTLSAGQPLNNNVWLLTTDELARAYVVPPRGFSGTMDVRVELRRPDNASIGQRIARLQWTVPPEEMVSNAAASQSEPPPRQLDGEEIAGLIKRGEQMVVTGDLAGARLLLRRAAEARNPRAALALAATYDPAVLSKLGAYGFKPDAEKAREWYAKAKDFGSAEAGRRLEQLAGATR